MTATPISQVLAMPADAKISCIEGRIKKIYPDPKTGTTAGGGSYRFENVVLSGPDGSEIKLKFANWPPLAPNWIGPTLRLTGKMTLEDWNGKRTVTLPHKDGSIEWNPSDYGQLPAPPPPAQNAYGPPQTQHGPPPPQSPPPAQPGPPPASNQGPPPQQGQARMPVHGATVGMAIKIACDIIAQAGHGEEFYASPQFSQAVHNIASDLIRVNHMLENGKLAPPVKHRNAPPRQPEPVLDRYQQQPDHRAGESRPAPMEEDEIPF